MAGSDSETRSGQQIIDSIVALATVSDGSKQRSINEPALQQDLQTLAGEIPHLLMIEDLIRPFSENITREGYRNALTSILQGELPPPSNPYLPSEDYPPLSRERISLLHANLEFILAEPMHIPTINRLGKTLVEMGIPQANIATHLIAGRHYNRQIRESGILTNMHRLHRYENNPSYISVVEQYVQHVDALMKFRTVSGIHIEPNADDYPTDVFDHEAFKEYLQHGALDEGWL